MPLSDLALSLMTFPQRWDGTTLRVNVLLLPVGDPTGNIGTGPPFAGTQYQLQLVLIPSLDSAPSQSDPAAIAFPITTIVPAAASGLWSKLKATLGPTVQVPVDPAGVRIRKTLPDSYTSSFPFERPLSSDATADDLYGCVIRDQDPGPLTQPLPPVPKTVNWGQVVSFALRQPKLAAALGLVYGVDVPMAAPSLVKGGWLFLRFDPAANPYPPDPTRPEQIKSFAARLPEIAGPRSLFAPVLFPLDTAAFDPALFDTAQRETQEYDDGFAKIVHANQPISADAIAGHQNELSAATDAGLQIGWDDEQVTVWHNRQLSARLADPVPLPLGVLGYRLDVRVKDSDPWTSLCSAKAAIRFDPSIDGDFPFEAPLEPTAVRGLTGDNTAWLPRYFAQWTGKSVVVADDVPYLLTAGKEPLKPSILSSTVPEGLLRYGTTYHFRTRLVDLTHGGPDSTGTPLHPAPATVGQIRFRRWVRPKAVRMQAASDPANPGTVQQISVWRPLIGYPELVFAGVDPSVVAQLVARATAAKATNAVLGASDPDVDTLRIVVEARAPAHDTTDPEQLDGPYRTIYQVDAPFPSILTPLPTDPPAPAEAVRITLDYQDVATIDALTAPTGASALSLPVPRARDVRIRLLAVAHSTTVDYFGSADLQEGITVHLDTRSDGGTEAGLFGSTAEPVDQLRAVFLQPVDDAALRLAQQLGLDVNGLTFTGRPGQRIVFSASAALRHTMSGDYSEITFATAHELQERWIVGITLTLARDWTWDGLTDEGFRVDRAGALVGFVEMRQIVGAIAVAPAIDPSTPQRDITRIVFFDVLDPNPPAGGFPEARTATWTITAQLRAGLTAADPPLSLSVRVPKAARPAQTPRIASAGIALSPYQAAGDYSSTAPRRRALWIEFEEPLADPADAYFARILGYGADPLLTGQTLDFSEFQIGDVVEPPLPIDPEPIRVIVPGQSPDTAGLDAMTKLIPASTPPGASPRHFLLPLPPGIAADAIELFGFWTYEFRVGHAGKALPDWSTAQGRYGRALRATGVQHPAPPLRCVASRTATTITVAAPFATPVPPLPLSFGRQPKTTIVVLLYTQIEQADGASRRNLLIAVQQASIAGANAPPPFPTRDIYGTVQFDAANGGELTKILQSISLPADSSLSALAVELLPLGVAVSDPLGLQLGSQRILRISPLTPIPPAC